MRVLAGDIGGTNTRLGIFEDQSGSPKLLELEFFPSSQGETFAQLLGLFLDKHPGPYDSACFGIAGPVKNGVCSTPNLPWTVSAEELKNEFQLPSVRLLNDLQAHAEGIEPLQPTDFVTLQKGHEYSAGNRALVSAGTGLGMAGLAKTGQGFVTIASEGGHADFAPRNALEMSLLKHLRGRFGRVSYERVLSGPGLENIYHFLVESEGRPGHPDIMESTNSAALITKSALSKDDETAAEALSMFASFYGSVAGNVALHFLSLGGLYLGGGIAPKISSVLQTEAFLEAFREKGRLRSTLEEIPVHIITNDKTALLGAALTALKMAKEERAAKSL